MPEHDAVVAELSELEDESDASADSTEQKRPVAQLFAGLWKAAPGLTAAWWLLLILGAALPSAFAVLTGQVVGLIAEENGTRLTAYLIALGACFLALQVLPQIATTVSMNLGSRLAAWLNRRLVRANLAPAGLAHLEDPDLATSRDFDRGSGGPPLYLAVDFVRGSLLQLLVGVASAIALAWYAWWAAILLTAAWASTHWMLRESSVWKDRNTSDVELAQQHAEYAYTLAVEPAPAKEIRLFGLDEWVIDRFERRRRELYEAQYLATRLREKSVAAAAAIVVVANVVVFGTMGYLAVDGAMSLQHLVAATQLSVGVQWVAFGGLSWAIDDAASGVVMVNRKVPKLAVSGRLSTTGSRAPFNQAIGLELRKVGFSYPRSTQPVYTDLDLQVRPGESLAVVGANGAGKTSLAKLLCRFYDPDSGSILADGVDLRELDLDGWRSRIAAVFQDFAKFERSLRDNVDPGRRCTDDEVRASLRDAGADHLTDLDIPMSKGYPGGTDLSGGQWQRVALARVLCSVRAGAGLVILDEPTANLDVRGEATIFSRLLEETDAVTTILISHRFSTVRMADRIAVLVDGQVAELGRHDELMAANGHYRRMFDLQASRFADDESEEEFDVLD